MKHFTHKSCEYHLLNMTLDRLPGLLAIETESHVSPWSTANFTSSITSSHHSSVLVDQSVIGEDASAKKNTQKPIAAYIITSTGAGEAELLNITVAPAYRRRGLASLLLDEACDSFESSIHNFFLEVRVSNTSAITLYDSLGFNEVGCRPNYYPAVKTLVDKNHDGNNGAREDALIMAKTLAF
ncbi:MAG: ribosomal-protein-alanine N-acetyltransferase [Cellvibrionaceae bacterium]|jgi:ribosomal-protein-alanine N-acetyltransferase